MVGRVNRNFKYKAFISYSHDDEECAQWLHQSLERYRVPKHVVQAASLETDRLVPIFRDRDELASASSLTDEIEKALSDSEFLIVVCSESSASSRWVNAEIEKFISLGGVRRILCLIASGEPPNCFPEALRTQEPLAADFRGSGDDRKIAKLKIVSGLLNVSLGDLQQRELQRRHRRLVAFAAASIAGMLIMATLAAFALFARQEAEREAKTANTTTQFLVDLFQGKVPENFLKCPTRGCRRELHRFHQPGYPVRLDWQYKPPSNFGP